MLIRLIGRKRLQPLLQNLHLISLTGMNYGTANNLEYAFTGEENVLKIIRQHANRVENFIFFDVGSNEGFYSEFFTTIFKGVNFQVFAFEPSKTTFKLLEQHAKRLPNIRAFNFGFGAKAETVSIWSNYEGSGAASIYSEVFNSYNQNRHVVEEISLQTIDSFCRVNDINRIDFLKIDVEGHELFVLQGAENLIMEKKIKIIQFEFGPVHVYSRTFFKDFWDLLSPLYFIYRIVGDGIVKISGYSENLEIFRTANFLAIIK